VNRWVAGSIPAGPTNIKHVNFRWISCVSILNLVVFASSRPKKVSVHGLDLNTDIRQGVHIYGAYETVKSLKVLSEPLI